MKKNKFEKTNEGIVEQEETSEGMITKKNLYLSTIESKNTKSMNKYKRVSLSPIRYPGGKSLAVGHIIDLLPKDTKRIISPFFGGGSVEIAISKHLNLEVIGYDIFDILMNYWKVQIKRPKRLYKELNLLKPTQKTYNKIKKELKNHWEGKIILDPVTLARDYFFNFNLSYGPGFLGWASKMYLNKERYQKILSKVENFSVKNLKVRCGSFEKAFKKYPNDLFYCDPPYYIGVGSKMFRGIYPQRNFPIHHQNFKHEELRDLLKNHKGGFILSYNDCPTIREWYKEYKQIFPTWQYTMGQGETRIGINRIESGRKDNIKKSHEIIIYKPPEVIK